MKSNPSGTKCIFCKSTLKA
ncbi:hypothetical protein [Providencia alcalifaciens]